MADEELNEQAENEENDDLSPEGEEGLNDSFANATGDAAADDVSDSGEQEEESGSVGEELSDSDREYLALGRKAAQYGVRANDLLNGYNSFANSNAAPQGQQGQEDSKEDDGDELMTKKDFREWKASQAKETREAAYDRLAGEHGVNDNIIARTIRAGVEDILSDPRSSNMAVDEAYSLIAKRMAPKTNKFSEVSRTSKKLGNAARASGSIQRVSRANVELEGPPTGVSMNDPAFLDYERRMREEGMPLIG